MNVHFSIVALLEKLRVNAVSEDGGACIADSVSMIRQAGLLKDSGHARPSATARRLERIASVNLSVARLMEGHVNALRLIEELGSEEQKFEIDKLLENDAFLGVWGADGDPPVALDAATGTLHGQKIYASGLSTVTHALITVDVKTKTQLCLVNVQETCRQDAAIWSMPGMRATRSGAFDFTGLTSDAATWIGPPDSYMTEPTFVGGVWRIAALQLGATLGLLDSVAAQLASLDRLEAEAQLIRLTPLAMRALAAEGLVTRAAEFAQSEAAQTNPERAVALSASARLLTEDLGLQTIAASEQSLGLIHFNKGSESGRMARDLAVYLRQAARDALVVRVGAHVFGAQSIWDIMP